MGVGLREIPYDEELFAGADQAEIAPRHFLDERGIVAEAPHLVAQAGVLAPDPLEVVGQPLVLAAGPHRGEQSLIADQGIDEERANHERQRHREDAAAESAPVDGEGCGGQGVRHQGP